MNNPQQPGFYTEVFIPDQLIAGNLKLVTANVMIGTGQLQRGTVLGKITATGICVPCKKSASDGSQVPYAILADYADASVGPVNSGAYQLGEFNGNALIVDPSWTLAELTDAARPVGIYIKDSVSAA